MVNSIIAGNNEECRYLNYLLKISSIFMENISLIIYSGLSLIKAIAVCVR